MAGADKIELTVAERPLKPAFVHVFFADSKKTSYNELLVFYSCFYLPHREMAEHRIIRRYWSLVSEQKRSRCQKLDELGRKLGRDLFAKAFFAPNPLLRMLMG